MYVTCRREESNLRGKLAKRARFPRSLLSILPLNRKMKDCEQKTRSLREAFFFLAVDNNRRSGKRASRSERVFREVFIMYKASIVEIVRKKNTLASRSVFFSSQ